MVGADAKAGSGGAGLIARGKLPRRLYPFVGRVQEKKRLDSLIRRSAAKLVTIRGLGGVGKTALAEELARREEKERAFPDGVRLIRLGTAKSLEDMVAAISDAVGHRETAAHSQEESLLRFLEHKTCLLVLDRPLRSQEVVNWLKAMLKRCAGVQLLTTCRFALRVKGEGEDEYEYELQTLPAPDPDGMPISSIRKLDGVKLFSLRRRARAPDRRPPQDAEIRATAKICHKLDGLPLAIEIVAGYRLTPAEILDSFERGALREIRLADGGDGSTIDAIIDGSHDLLSADERVLFRRLSVFTGSFDYAAIRAVCLPLGNEADGEPSDFRLARLVSSLGEKNLLRELEPLHGESRFALLEIIRDHAGGRLREVGTQEEAEIRRRHAQHFLALTKRIKEPVLRGAAERRWLDELEANYVNLRTALEYLVQAGDFDQALRLTGRLPLFWLIRGRFTEGRNLLVKMLERAHQASPGPRGDAAFGAGWIAWARGEYETAREYLLQARDLFAEAGDEIGLARTLLHLGTNEHALCRDEEASAFFDEALQRYRERNHRIGVGWTLHNQGILEHDRKNHRLAADLHEQALPHFKAEGDLWGMAWCRHAQGNAMRDAGDLEGADSVLRQALRLFEDELDDRRGEAWTLRSLGTLTFRCGLRDGRCDHREADEFLRRAVILFGRLDDRRGLALSLERLGQVAQAAGQLSRAARLLGAEESIRREFGTPLQADQPPSPRGTELCRKLGEFACSAARQEGEKLARSFDFEQLVAA